MQVADSRQSEAEIKQAVEAAVTSIGDSVVPVAVTLGPDTVVAKVHVHTNEPELAFARLRTLAHNGMLIKQKVEDMVDQVAETKLPPFPDVRGKGAGKLVRVRAPKCARVLQRYRCLFANGQGGPVAAVSFRQRIGPQRTPNSINRRCR